jgi:hypothetical protein
MAAVSRSHTPGIRQRYPREYVNAGHFRLVAEHGDSVLEPTSSYRYSHLILPRLCSCSDSSRSRVRRIGAVAAPHQRLPYPGRVSPELEPLEASGDPFAQAYQTEGIRPSSETVRGLARHTGRAVSLPPVDESTPLPALVGVQRFCHPASVQWKCQPGAVRGGSGTTADGRPSSPAPWPARRRTGRWWCIRLHQMGAGVVTVAAAAGRWAAGRWPLGAPGPAPAGGVSGAGTRRPGAWPSRAAAGLDDRAADHRAHRRARPGTVRGLPAAPLHRLHHCTACTTAPRCALSGQGSR